MRCIPYATESHAQHDPTFRTTLAYTRLTAGGSTQAIEAAIAISQYDGLGTESQWLSAAQSDQGQASKKTPETDAIFANIRHKGGESDGGQQLKRLGMDCKAAVNIGRYARGGKTRGDHRADDHDMGCQEKYVPFGLVDEDSSQLHLTFGSSYKTSDFIVDSLEAWRGNLSAQEQAQTQCIQLKVDNGPESGGVRTQFLSRMVQVASRIDKAILLLCFPPITASISRPSKGTTPSNGAGVFWSNIGMARCWWMPRPCSNGRRQ